MQIRKRQLLFDYRIHSKKFAGWACLLLITMSTLCCSHGRRWCEGCGEVVLGWRELWSGLTTRTTAPSQSPWTRRRSTSRRGMARSGRSGWDVWRTQSWGTLTATRPHSRWVHNFFSAFSVYRKSVTRKEVEWLFGNKVQLKWRL